MKIAVIVEEVLCANEFELRATALTWSFWVVLSCLGLGQVLFCSVLGCRSGPYCIEMAGVNCTTADDK